MKKLTLDELRVESFATEMEQNWKGSVVGAQDTVNTNCTCPLDYTCHDGCSDGCSIGCLTNGGPSCWKCPDEN